MSLYKELKNLRKDYHPEVWMDYYFYRRISIFLNMIFISLRVSPIIVNILVVLADFLVIYLMYINQWIFAGILVHLAAVLDCCDGDVARYYAYKKGKKYGNFGAYLDSVVGTVGFTLIVFFAGYFLGNIWVGLFAMFGLFMVILSAGYAAAFFKQKNKIAKSVREKLFGKRKIVIGFTDGIQRWLVSISIFFASLPLLFIFGLIANAFWIFKFWVYRKY